MKLVGKVWLFILILTLVIILLVSYFIFQYTNETKRQRKYSQPQKKQDKNVMILIGDSVLPNNQLFLTETSENQNINDIDILKLQKMAHQFFQKQYGLDDSYIKKFMKKTEVNSKVGYHYVTTDGEVLPVIDKGFSCYIPERKSLYGKYGGKNGLITNRDSILMYGYYQIGDRYKILYKCEEPFETFITYNGSYTPINYDIEMLEASDDHLVGLKGKGEGIYKNRKLNNGENSVVIRNILTWF